MKFKDLSDSDKEYIAKVHSNKDLTWDERMQILTSKYNVSERTARRWTAKLQITASPNPIEESTVFETARRRELESSKYYIITWAQNETPVHSKFWQNILTYADFLGAKVHVIAGRYQNPHSLQSSRNRKREEWWTSKVVPYLDANRHDIHPLLTLLSDIKVQPTASLPLSGFYSVSGVKSAIVGHPKVHFESLPVLEGHPSKVLCTTGACTVPNYTDTKAGAKGEFHHTFGFVVVEIVDHDNFIIRQVTANSDGSFTDLDRRVEDEKIFKQKRFPFFVMGDLHPRHLDHNHFASVVEFLGKRCAVDNLILHDVYDSYCISHHHEKDPILKYQKRMEGSDSVMAEIEEMIDTIRPLIKFNPVIVRSNHDEHLDNWIRSGDWKKDTTNSLTYVEMASLLLSGKAVKGIIPYYLEQEFGGDIRCLVRDESFKLKGWELAHHGDIGPNGSRGSILGFSKLNTKVVIGHSHSCGRRDGCIQTGTTTKKRLGYNMGASSWMNAHVLGHEDGKAQLLIPSNNIFTTID